MTVPMIPGGAGNIGGYNRLDQSTTATSGRGLRRTSSTTTTTTANIGASDEERHALNGPLHASPSEGDGDEEKGTIGGGGGDQEGGGIGGLSPPEENVGGIVLVMLDTRQQKFRIGADPDWTVQQFKSYAAAKLQVPASSQRLIHMGQLLNDSKTLREYNLTTSEKIVHLFPKPNVVVASSTNNVDGEDCDAEDGGGEDSSPGGNGGTSGMAHVPQIVLDPDHDSSLVVTTNELFEAQHRVKLLAFLLLIICSMELLTLVTIFLGPTDDDGSGHGSEPPPGDPTDPAPQYDPDADVQMRTWRTSDYFDVVLSSAGFYVSMLGLKASTENTLVVARQYFLGLVVVGVSWLGYYYYLSIDQINRTNDAYRHCGEDFSNDDTTACDPNAAVPYDGNIYMQALVGLTLPIAVWMICFLRAFQFRMLLAEASREAEERRREQTEQLTAAVRGTNNASGGGSGDDGGAEGETATTSGAPLGNGDASTRPLARQGRDYDSVVGNDLRLSESVVIV